MDALNGYKDYIIYDPSSKSISKVSGCYNEEEGLQIAQKIYSVLFDIGEIMESDLSRDSKLQRFTLTYSTYELVVVFTAGLLHIVKRSLSSQ